LNGQKDLTPYREPAIRGLFVVGHSRCCALHSLRTKSKLCPPLNTLCDVLERLHHNQLALEAALMELTLLVGSQGHAETGDNVRGALDAIGENAGISSRA
jgi:hypothetical protein